MGQRESKLPYYMRFNGIRYLSENSGVEVTIMNILTGEEIGIYYRDLPEEWKSECDEYLGKFNISIQK